MGLITTNVKVVWRWTSSVKVLSEILVELELDL